MFFLFSSKLKWGLKDFCRIKMLAASGVSCTASVKWWCRYLFAQAKLSEQNSSKRELFYFYNFCWAQATVVHFCELLPRKCIPWPEVDNDRNCILWDELTDCAAVHLTC